MNTTTLTREDLIVKTYRQECRDNGTKETTRKWANTVINEWNLMLESHDTTPSQSHEIKAIIRENLSIRDAIIIASMNPNITVDELTLLVADAHTANMKREMNRLLNDAYYNGSYDHGRAAKAITLLDRLAADNDIYSAQPNAIIAWLEWLNGNDGNSLSHALAALEADDECTLAAIAHAATSQGLRPAYLG